LHELVRHYAEAHLDTESEVTRQVNLRFAAQRHATYYLALVEQAAPRYWTGAGGVLRQLEHEHDNIRAALACCQGRRPTQRGEQMPRSD
jgi:hypothetical protein